MKFVINYWTVLRVKIYINQGGCVARLPKSKMLMSRTGSSVSFWHELASGMLWGENGGGKGSWWPRVLTEDCRSFQECLIDDSHSFRILQFGFYFPPVNLSFLFLLLSPAECGGRFKGESSGRILSPGYPFPYDNNLRCTWVIEVDSGNIVRCHSALLHHFNTSKTNILQPPVESYLYICSCCLKRGLFNYLCATYTAMMNINISSI